MKFNLEYGFNKTYISECGNYKYIERDNLTYSLCRRQECTRELSILERLAKRTLKARQEEIDRNGELYSLREILEMPEPDDRYETTWQYIYLGDFINYCDLIIACLCGIYWDNQGLVLSKKRNLWE